MTASRRRSGSIPREGPSESPLPHSLFLESRWMSKRERERGGTDLRVRSLFVNIYLLM